MCIRDRGKSQALLCQTIDIRRIKLLLPITTDIPIPQIISNNKKMCIRDRFYTNRYHKNMEQLNTLPPSIEPHASGHILEQQALVKKILENGYAYESDGSIYFDVEAYNKKYPVSYTHLDVYKRQISLKPDFRSQVRAISIRS